VSALHRQPINGSTRLVGLIGDPVAHSRSPALHNAAFAALGLNYAYVPLPVRATDLAAALAGLSALGFVGANVTVPHKQAAAALVDRLCGDAELLEAVNTIVLADNRLEGHNTDVEGFLQSFRALTMETPRSALVLGAGGAARAVVLGLLRLGCRHLAIANRTPAAAAELAERVHLLEARARVEVLALTELEATVVREREVIVNATSLGMLPDSKVPAAVADNLSVDQIVYDVVYASGTTALVRAARASGARAIDGSEMLVGQAAAAFRLWTGLPAPLNEMRRALTE